MQRGYAGEMGNTGLVPGSVSDDTVKLPINFK
jgi:hypothetical protein